ncbi:MAG: hypothetical protein J2P57_23330, partial [Acidimicrobiaceae bacterium]|nr:hypothetical protein [Acidimicrobiaceae bacterium]
MATATRRSTARRRPAARKGRRRGPGRAGPLARLSEVLGQQADDVWGAVLCVLGLLAAMGIYIDVAGPAGRGLRAGTADGFGWARVLIPLALVVLGATLIWSPVT